jgi:nitroimidazol reductase NimA-like FMN-containing flavoprotein (pyridoxamine 5'-phosphate oxidase superfamily)
MMGELSEQEIINVLSSQVIGRLACSDGVHPYIVPVTYMFDGDFIYGQTSEGSKLNILRKNKHVCFEVDILMDMRNWQSVIVKGSFEELENEAAEIAKELLFKRIFPLQTSSTIHKFEHEVHDDPVEVEKSKNKFRYVMYRIKPEKITGRYEKQ